MIRDADIAAFIDDDDTPRPAERPDWLDGVFTNTLLPPAAERPRWQRWAAAGVSLLIWSAALGAVAAAVAARR